MRQMACHPDLVLRSKTNAAQFVPGAEEATVCRLCNDVAEDAIQARCRHIFDRECIKQYLEAALEQVVCGISPASPSSSPDEHCVCSPGVPSATSLLPSTSTHLLWTSKPVDLGQGKVF